MPSGATDESSRARQNVLRGIFAALLYGAPCEESGFEDKTCADKTLVPLKVASAGGTPLGCYCIPK